MKNFLEFTYSTLSVSTPAEVGLPYEEIKLTTSDGVKLRTYVLVQKRDLKGARTMRTSVSTDAEVGAHLFDFSLKYLTTLASALVCQTAANRVHIPRKRRKLWRWRRICEDILFKNAVERGHGFLSGVRSIFCRIKLPKFITFLI